MHPRPLRNLLLLPCLTLTLGATETPQAPRSLVFNPEAYTLQSLDLNGRTIRFRAYEGIVTVANPVDLRYQTLNIYVPAEYYEGKSIGPYNVHTAPIFLPNSVGGYMPGPAGKPGPGFGGKKSNAALVALSHGLVVAAPGARGRTCVDTNGQYTGKAPAAIVDLKAAVRYLRANAQRLPGNTERIISNGTSAGGALSALLGATGNAPDYEPYLKAIGAAEARDDVFAVSAYCPITNLDHADTAYEWLFAGIYDYQSRRFPGMRPGGPAGAPGPGMPPPGSAPGQPSVKKTMDADQIHHSKALGAAFPAYVNSLGLKDEKGHPLTLDAQGKGSFRDYVKSKILDSAQKALNAGSDLSKTSWLRIKAGKAVDLDWDTYLRSEGRLKATSAFDSLDLGTPENSLFGTATVNARHFTAYSAAHSTKQGALAEAEQIKLMNPMNYIGRNDTTVTRHWRIRNGSVDRDTSLAIPTILACTLRNHGAEVDFFMPWNQGHGGDYDLDELFAWVEQTCR